MYETRQKQLQTALNAHGADVFIAASPETVGFFTGFDENAGERFRAWFFNADGRQRMIGPALSENQARRTGITEFAAWRDGECPISLAKELAREWNLTSAIFAVDEEMPALMLLNLQTGLPAALFKPGGPVLGDVTRTKGPIELAALTRAAKIADEAFEAVVPQIKVGMTELEISELLYKEMAARGGQPTFAIIAAGVNAAEPHHHSDGTRIALGETVIMDFGCLVEGYHSDITRTVSVGPPTDLAKSLYQTVYEAHLASKATVKVGVAAKSVDEAGRAIIEAAGQGEFFYHRIGHGIGRRIHEAPYIVGDNEELLREGDCFSIEPGIYRAGEIGIRIENIYTVTEAGGHSFNAGPPDHLIVVG
jgi:Xaa-Pro dipeptidase